MKHSVRLIIALAILSVLAPPSAFSSSLALPAPAAVETINPTELRQHLEFLASPELGGRFTLSSGLNIAARYIASRLESYGYKGLGPHGSMLQSFEVQSSKVDGNASYLKLTVGGKEKSIAYGDFASFSDSNGVASGRIVFVGYGIASPAVNHDDYAGLDVKGKIVLMASGVPEGIDSSKIPEAERGEAAARARGAVGVISLPSARFLSFMKSSQFKEFMRTRENIDLKAANRSALPEIMLTPDVADDVLKLIGLSMDKLVEITNAHGALAPAALDASAEFLVKVEATTTSSQNVVAVLEGSDPARKSEYIAISAHYDHLKTNAKGEIFPGADDDGSGTAAVITLARAFAAQRPARSVVVVFHAGEELGLLGSEYNTDIAPAIPLNKIVADFNIDMIGRSKKPGDTDARNKELTDANSIYLIGADKISPELNQISEATNVDTVNMRLDYTYNDPNHPQQFYYRSDHWNYAKHGIPVIFYFSGVHEDYHQTTDTVDKIDFDKMTKVARLVFATAWRVANLDHRLAIPAAAAAAGAK